MKDYSIYGDAANYPCSLVMSGVESDAYFDIAIGEGIDRMLMSYHYIQRKGKNFLRDRLSKHPHVKMMIDSGAHTFHAKEEEFSQKPLEFWEKYLERYTNFIRANKEFIFSCVELDIANLVGFDKVDYFREKYFEPLREEGILVCYVWHDYDGDKHWEEMCQKYDYVGFSLVNTDMGEKDIIRKMNIARKHGALVHGFAVTRVEIMSKMPFFTGDSSVSADSSITVRNKTTGEIERKEIGVFFAREDIKQGHIRTSEVEKIVPLDNYETLTVNDDLEVVWGDLYSVVRHDVKKPTIRYNIEGGKTLEVTTDHSVISMDKEGNLIEVKADSLKEGDFVLAPPSYSNENEPVGYVNAWIQKPNTQSNERELQVVQVTNDFLEFLGMWVGDGHYTGNDVVGFSCYQDSECREVIDRIFTLYGAKIDERPNGVDVRVSNVRLRRVMEALGFKGTSSTKRVPKFIYSLHVEQINSFLRGYFSADGSGSHLDCSTISKELKNDLVELLEMQGIYTSVSNSPKGRYNIRGKVGDKKESWHITIRDLESKIKFYENIGFMQDYKNDSLQTTIKEQLSKGKSNTPIGAKRLGLPTSLSNSDYCYYPSGRTVNKSKVKRITRSVKENFSEKVFNCGLHFLQIKSVEVVNDGSEVIDVYDLSVSGTEKFFANGILVHNTTWLVGTQYGELNWFDGRKMRRLKKDKWKKEYKQKYISIGANWDLAGEENPYELIRINLIVFKQAEEYIRKRIRGKSYWLSDAPPISLRTSKSLRSNAAAPTSKEVNKVMEEKPKKKLKRKIKKASSQVEETAPQEKAEVMIGETTKQEIPKEFVQPGKPKSKLEEFMEQSEKPEPLDLDLQLSKLPSREWFDGDMEDLDEYLADLQMNFGNVTRDYILDTLFNYVVFLTDGNEDIIEPMDDATILGYCTGAFKRSFTDREEAIAYIKERLIANLTLQEDTLLMQGGRGGGTLEAIEHAKEREVYLEDEEFELVDLTDEELTLYLPSPNEGEDMPEVAELDKELSTKGVVAVRDEKGRFLKGQKRVRKPKNIYSEKFPKLACNTCYKAGDCPEFQPDSVCAYDKIFKKFDVRNSEDIMDAMSSMVNLNLGRLQRQTMFETMDGGMADGTVTAMIDQNMNLLMKMKQLQDQPRVVATQHRTLHADGRQEETTVISNPRGEGILSRIFGNATPENDREMDEREDVIDADAKEVK